MKFFPYGLAHIVMVAAFYYDESAVHLVMVNMLKQDWLNWNIGVTRQPMRYLGFCAFISLLYNNLLAE